MSTAIETPVNEMTDREIAEETLSRLRFYETVTRQVIEAGKKNPMLAAMLRANGITL